MGFLAETYKFFLVSYEPAEDYGWYAHRWMSEPFGNMDERAHILMTPNQIRESNLLIYNTRIQPLQ